MRWELIPSPRHINIQVKGTFSISPETNVYPGNNFDTYRKRRNYLSMDSDGFYFPRNNGLPQIQIRLITASIYDPVTSCTADAQVKIWLFTIGYLWRILFIRLLIYPMISVHGGTGPQILMGLDWSIYDRWGEKVFESMDVKHVGKSIRLGWKISWNTMQYRCVCLYVNCYICRRYQVKKKRETSRFTSIMNKYNW